MTDMKKNYFFFDGKKRVIIQEFDYFYVRNSLLRVFDKNESNPKEYFFEVVVSRTFDSAGVPSYDVRRLDLNGIYYDNNVNLRVLEMMKDDILWGQKIQLKNMPLPPLKQEYEDFKAGKVIAAPAIVTSDIPPPKVIERKELSVNDRRIPALSEMPTTFNHNPMVSLDWIENFELCNQSLTTTVQQLSGEQLALVKMMKSSSDYIHTVFDNLSTALESLFPIRPTVMQRWFGNTKFEVDDDNIEMILEKLTSAVNVDPTRFSGIDSIFNQLHDSIDAIQLNVEHGIVGCQYVLDTEEDPYEFEMRHSRLMKVRASTSITELSLVDIHKRYVVNYSKLNEIQTTLIPLLISRLQSQTTSVVDEDTVNIIKNLAKVQKI